MKPLLTLALALLCASCGAQAPIAIPADYAGAVKAVRAAYDAETWTPDSSLIRKVEHYPDSPRLFLIVTFTSGPKPYIYEGVPTSLVREWKAADSAGRWYNANLKGNRFYFFRK